MIFGMCRFKNPVSLLSFLAFISCLSLGLIYHFINKKEKVIERYKGLKQISSVDSSCVLTVAVWTGNICPKMFDNLEWFPKFPNFPDKRQCAKNLSSIVRTGTYNTAVIKRILVSFSNVEPGFYQFRARSSLPLKISLDNGHQSPGRKLVLVTSGSVNFLTVFSKSFFLNKNSSLEIIAYCPPGDNVLALDWLVPGSASFRPIFSRDLLPVVHVTPYQNPPLRVLPPDRSTLVGFIPRGHVMKGFRVCSANDIEVWRNNQTSRNVSAYNESSQLDHFIREVLKQIMASLQKVAPR